MADIIGRLVEYNTGARDRRDNIIWDVGRVRAVAFHQRAAGPNWEILIETHSGELAMSLADEVCLVDERRAKQLERNRAARRVRKQVRRG